MTEAPAATLPVRSEDEEIWELQVASRVHVEVTNHLGRPADRTVKGYGARLRISTTDRQLAEEKILRPELNPFRNGMLRYVTGGKGSDVESRDSLSKGDLIELFAIKDAEFEELLESLSEVNVRRMESMLQEVDATASQIKAVKDCIARRWPIGGSTPTYDEMNAVQP